jgi:hypothetical protein
MPPVLEPPSLVPLLLLPPPVLPPLVPSVVSWPLVPPLVPCVPVSVCTGEVVPVSLPLVSDVLVEVEVEVAVAVVVPLSVMPPLPVGVLVVASVALPPVVGDEPCVVPPLLALPPSVSVAEVAGVVLQATTNAEIRRGVGRIARRYTVVRAAPTGHRRTEGADPRARLSSR